MAITQHFLAMKAENENFFRCDFLSPFSSDGNLRKAPRESDGDKLCEIPFWPFCKLNMRIKNHYAILTEK